MTHNTTTTPTHNNNVSNDKPSTVEAIKEKAAAVVGKITGKHHTDNTHGTNDQHHHGDPNVTHTTGTGTHTGATGAHTGATGTHTGPHTGVTGAHTGHAGTHTGAPVPGAAPTAVHSTGAGITSGGNTAPPAATHAQGTHGTHGTGLAGAAATQPLNHQHNPNLQHGGMTTNTGNPAAAAETKAAFDKGVDIGTRHPERLDQAVHDATIDMVGRQPNEQAAFNATANTVAHDPRKADAFTDNVAARLVGKPGDPNNLEAAHIKPTM
ncbi:hypothetical protein BGZ96_003316 [Linnemannia gamsii]|uniref:Uncharacterized protein n=1 Tax=Linnemannia gamsii TaxID=64522 RepID=A0ABQ7KIF0_9FUNG|nr:hypothetical protein BGZ96_003316 [Linnemannia gamsii]